MNRQEIFDKVVAHARTQQRQARSASGCMYRAPNGLKCFAGCLIPDELYDPTIEGRGVPLALVSGKDNLYESGPSGVVALAKDKTLRATLNASGIADEDFAFLDMLQSIHDNSPPTRWENQFAQAAESRGLEFQPQ